MLAIFILLVGFQIKHFLADYLLQDDYMLGKAKAEKWVLPLFAHVLVHGVFTVSFAIVLTRSVELSLFLMVLDMVAHFIIDRIKASPNMLGIYKPNQPQFWYALGFDQMLHHITHYTIIYIILLNEVIL